VLCHAQPCAGSAARRVVALSMAVIGLVLASFGGTAWATDWDSDAADANDCAPLDPAVHPGAVDKPDLGFEDTNCDGIDGDLSKAIFVTLGGDDGAPGTKTNPMRHIAAAVTAASAAGKDVYIAAGTYSESVPLADNVSLYGGYEPITGSRSAANATTIVGAPAALAFGDSGVVLQLLTLSGQQDGAGNAYGLRAVKDGADPSRVLLEKVTAQGSAAADGGNGGTGGTGFFGFGVFGFAGGAGGCGSGVLGSFGTPGGLPGGPGGSGASNALATADAAAWPRPFAGSGSQGGVGGGGAGGRGGTGASGAFGTPLCGGTGGTGGRGGGGGFGGTGGQNGGGSFGAYVFDSSLTAVDSQLIGATGGDGGDGGNGGLGGSGAGGFAGSAGACEFIFFQICAADGNVGFPGQPGGQGGGGGGGAGGPSAGLFRGGPGSDFTALAGTTTSHGAGGAGGVKGNGGATPASAGTAVDVMQSATAPSSSSADFDGDAITDSADACPAIARGATDANGDGCPDRPAKLVDANGNGIPDSAEASSAQTTTDTGTTPAAGSGGSTVAAPAIARVAAKWTTLFKPTRTATTVKKLVIAALGKHDTVKATCAGRGCPFKSKSMKPLAGKADLARLFKKKGLRPKTVVTIWVMRPGAIGQVMRFTVRKGKAPARANMCLPLGGKKPQAAC